MISLIAESSTSWPDAAVAIVALLCGTVALIWLFK